MKKYVTIGHRLRIYLRGSLGFLFISPTNKIMKDNKILGSSSPGRADQGGLGRASELAARTAQDAARRPRTAVARVSESLLRARRGRAGHASCRPPRASRAGCRERAGTLGGAPRRAGVASCVASSTPATRCSRERRRARSAQHVGTVPRAAH
jgi:hypothetical protein